MIKSRVIKLMLTALTMTSILGMETVQKSKATEQTGGERNSLHNE